MTLANEREPRPLDYRGRLRLRVPHSPTIRMPDRLSLHFPSLAVGRTEKILADETCVTIYSIMECVRMSKCKTVDEAQAMRDEKTLGAKDRVGAKIEWTCNEGGKYSEYG
jgi:hypothetical protein